MLKKIPWRYFVILLAANLTLFLPDASVLRVAGALLLIGLLPGFSWANWLLAQYSPLLRWTTAAALSFTITTLTVLLLHYLPGPIQLWQFLIILNFIAVIPTIRIATYDYTKNKSLSQQHIIPALILIFLLAILLRGSNLHYSEFQGDEALAMISAAEALEGHDDALFLRSKGPGEVLVPTALWRLTGTINEPIARLPFTIASLLAIITIFLIGNTIGGKRIGWLAAGFFAFNGFAVAFGRIVQYQALVLWMSAIAFLLALQWRQTGQLRLVILGGLCLGTGLLAHYDAILVIPAILWLFVMGTTADDQPTINILELGGKPWSTVSKNWAVKVKTIGLFLLAFFLTALAFYLPYILNPRSNRTGEYVGGRIGNQLRNNLPNFFHFNTFYSSSYYILLTSLLVFGLLIWLVWRAKWGRRWIALLLASGISIIILFPNLLQINDELNLSALPFALLFACAFFALPFSSNGQSLIVWLATPFLGYNFVVALGLTHIYTIIPAWSLLAAMGWYTLFDLPRPGWQWVNRASNYVLGGLVIISTIFLWNAFVRHDVEYWQDYPDGNLPFYWNPYNEPPPAGFFGFAHRTGWKAVGQKMSSGELAGDYGSNEEPDVTTWYMRGAPRACDPQPEFYFLADDLIDAVDVPTDIIESSYEQTGQVILPNQKQMQIMQLRPATLTLGNLDDVALSRTFDQTATPAAFARSVRGAIPADANFGDLIKLIGYDIDTHRATPGGRLPVTLYWQALAPIPASYQVFTHLESDSGLVAQADGVPACWTYPTTDWQPGQIIADQHAIPISPEVQPGSYRLDVGLYLPDTFTRLDVLDEAGNPAGTHITLQTVELRE